MNNKVYKIKFDYLLKKRTKIVHFFELSKKKVKIFTRTRLIRVNMIA